MAIIYLNIYRLTAGCSLSYYIIYGYLYLYTYPSYAEADLYYIVRYNSGTCKFYGNLQDSLKLPLYIIYNMYNF